jgi:Tol biopolymer transport system component/tRNA A-37 threonylcarbamoyl transferase component Bud32
VAIDAGQQLLHFRLIEKIGQGGMGVVWKAEDTKLHRHIALKVLPESMAADPNRRARFEREARAVAALNHPNIVTLHSVEEAETPTGPVHLITMELVEGRTLTELLPKGGFPLDRLLEIAIPLADAVSRAHRAGITHRDLKPDNIMIDDDGRLRVLDFGLAKLHDPSGATLDTQAATVTSDTAEGRVLGTVAYMSPEQAEGKPVDARSDVFSLGTILYQMATGRRPFDGDTRMSTISAILKDDPRPITESHGGLPRDAWRIIRRCLNKDPKDRYASARELHRELVEWRAEIGETHAKPGPLRRVLPAAGLLLAVVAGVLISRAMRGDSAARERVAYKPVPMTSGLGMEIGPSWSPEGEFIAYSEVRNGSMDVVVQPLAGGDPVVRADGPGDEASPRWSPDGRHLAYVSTSEPGSPVYLVPPHGGQRTKLIDTGALRTMVTSWGMLGHQPWSPDGRTLLVALQPNPVTSTIHRVDRDTGTAEPLTAPTPGLVDFGASYSPDGGSIVFLRAGPIYDKSKVMTMPVDGDEPEVLLENVRPMPPAFRPDGRRLVFNREGNLWELDLDSGEETQLTFEAVHAITSFAVSATNRIAYQSFWHDNFLFTVDVASGVRRQLTSTTGDNSNARYSPDGKTIAYASTRTGNWEIYSHSLEDGAETRLTDHADVDDWPDWSPDGESLVYFAGSDLRRLTRVNRDGGGAQVLDEQRSFGPARWSPSGQRIAFVSIAEQFPVLWTVGSDGADARPVQRFAHGFDWYLDDRRGICAILSGTEVELFAIDLETGRTRSLYVGPVLELDIAPDGSALALAMGPSHISLSLVLMQLETSPEDGLPSIVGEPETLVRAEGTWHIHLGGWSPDSKSIVYTRDQDYGDIFELVESVDEGE